jgi:hypothetical protein
MDRDEFKALMLNRQTVKLGNEKIELPPEKVKLGWSKGESEEIRVYNYKTLTEEIIRNYQDKPITSEFICDTLGIAADKRSFSNISYYRKGLEKQLQAKGYTLNGTLGAGMMLGKVDDVKTEKKTRTGKPAKVSKVRFDDSVMAPPLSLPSSPAVLEVAHQVSMMDKLIQKLGKHPGEIIAFNNYLQDHGLPFKLVITAVEMQEIVPDKEDANGRH